MKMEHRSFAVAQSNGNASWNWIVAGIAVAVAAAIITPVGYVGSGADDEQYLNAARCWVESGAPCQPQSHWWTRWPAFAPLALFSGLLGESRLSVAIGPALWWFGALFAFAALASQWFDRRAAGIGLAFLGSTPVFASIAFGPNTDIPELALQLAALALATAAYRRQSGGLAIIAGVMAGLAMQARDTSLLFIGVSAVGWLFLDRQRRAVLVYAVAGLVGAIATEMLFYWLATGDPLTRYRLALGHTAIPSAALPEGFHSSRGPLLNADFIRSWKREAGLTLWWPIDPWLNLLASARSGILAWGAVVALALLGKRMPAARGKTTAIMIGAALTVAVALIYVLAIDPRPRMFLLLWAALAAASGAALASSLSTESRPLALTILVLVPILGLQVMLQYPASAPAETRAKQWYARYGTERIELDPGASSYLTLLPETRQMALRGSGKPYIIVTSAVHCAEQIKPARGVPPRGRVIDEVSGNNSRQGYLCLFEYLPVRAG